MSTDRLWAFTVIIGFSTLLILSYFVLTPLASKESTLIKTDETLRGAVDRFQHLKDEDKNLDEFSLNP